MGQGTNDKVSNHLSWIVLNWNVQVFKRPKIYEHMLVKACAQHYTRLQTNRDYDVFNEFGEKIAQATSVWATVDIESKRLVRISSGTMDVYGCEPEHQNFPDFKFQRIGQIPDPLLSSQTFRINKSMIDCNNHVHNPAYLDLAMEVLPAPLDTFLFNNVAVSYRREITPGETVMLEYFVDDARHYFFIKALTGDSIHAAIVLY